MRFNRRAEGKGVGGVVRLRALLDPNAGIRTAQLREQEYVVVPVIGLVEGVLHASNSSSPELALADEFAAYPEAWNGSPVLVGHPQNDDGAPISANQPDVWEKEVIGTIFNTRREDDKLKMEAWINRAWAEEAGQGEILTALEKGEVLEVSTGLFATVEQSNGTYGGKRYNGVWRNVAPDHLAILPPGTIGACSVEAGCGTRQNSAVKTSGASCKCGGTCGGCQASTPADVVSSLTTGDNSVTPKTPSIFSRALASLKDLMGLSDLGDVNTRLALKSALKASGEFDSWGYYDVMQVYGDHFIYYAYNEAGEGMFRRDYTIAQDGAVTLGQEVTEVRAETQYVTVKANEAEQATEDPPQAPATTEAAPPQPTLNEASPMATETPTVPAPAAPVVNAAPAAQPLTLERVMAEAPADVVALLNAGRKALKDNEERAAKERAELITKIKANQRSSFDDAELTAFELPVLQKLATLADANYEGRGVHNEPPAAPTSDEKFLRPLEAFPVKAA